LFAAIEGVRSGTMNIEQAKTISELSQVVVNSARVEVEFVRATQRNDSQFLAPAIDAIADASGAAPGQAKAAPGNGILGITRHILEG